MRILMGLAAAAASVLVVSGWLAPVSAQDGATPTDNPHNLPSTHFASDAPIAGHGFEVPPGFSKARAAVNPLAPDAKPIGEETCTSCHTLETQNFAHTTHALGMKVALAADPATATCETCHGAGSEHMANPTAKDAVISFTKDGGTPIETQNETCMSCHTGGARDQWLGSVHQRNDLSCSDCHNPMARLSAEGLAAKPSISETCATCHKDVRQQFNRRSHMPLPEGQMACVDCHNPHGTFNDALLKADTVNEGCTECHAEKRGPFLFEHAPVRDSCLNCHQPHGANQHALLNAPVPMLCQQCHSHIRHPNDLFTEDTLGTGTLPDERTMGRGCLTCHSQIHGSNNPSGPRLHK